MSFRPLNSSATAVNALQAFGDCILQFAHYPEAQMAALDVQIATFKLQKSITIALNARVQMIQAGQKIDTKRMTNNFKKLCSTTPSNTQRWNSLQQLSFGAVSLLLVTVTDITAQQQPIFDWLLQNIEFFITSTTLTDDWLHRSEIMDVMRRTMGMADSEAIRTFAFRFVNCYSPREQRRERGSKLNPSCTRCCNRKVKCDKRTPTCTACLNDGEGCTYRVYTVERHKRERNNDVEVCQARLMMAKQIKCMRQTENECTAGIATIASVSRVPATDNGFDENNIPQLENDQNVDIQTPTVTKAQFVPPLQIDIPNVNRVPHQIFGCMPLYDTNKLPEPFGRAAMSSRQWKWERASGMVETSVIQGVYPMNPVHDASITILCSQTVGYEIGSWLGLSKVEDPIMT